MSNIVFGSVNSSTYSVAIFDEDTDSAPARVYDRYEVAGRNGDLFVDQQRFENLQHIYWGIIYSNYETNLKNFRAAMRSQVGYKKLTDSFHADEYYDACFIEVLEVETGRNRDIGRFQIIFDRKPQRWLTSGDTETTLSTTGTISNPTSFTSYPLIRAYGTGTVTIGSYVITISAADTYTDIDCDTMEAYKGSSSKNANVSFGGTGKPGLAPGSNNIALSSGITQVKITPRWYTI